MASRIEDYALIGDLGTAALVGRDGSIDWLCWPRFDSDACLAALLGGEENGRWLVAPHQAKARITRRYRGSTLILETRFETKDGAATLIDFMPRRNGGSHIVRIVVGERGRIAFHSEFVLRFGYGANVPWVTRIDEQTVRAIVGPDMAVLRAPAPVHGENFKTVTNFTVHAGERKAFVLSYARSNEPLPAEIDAEAELSDTEKFWTDWSGRNQIVSPWNEAVCRSLITLKALTYEPTGGMVAAPTTSLPEQIGGPRNWDYRYCWLRDATLDAARADERRLLRRGAQLARLAAARRRRFTAPDPDHVRHPRRAAAHRMGGALARRLREVDAGAHRQRRAQPVAARYFRRGDGRAAPGARRAASAATRPAGIWSANSSPIWRRSGRSPTRASGRCAAGASTSPIPRSWPGSPSTAR